MRYLRPTRTKLLVVPALLVVIIAVAFGAASTTLAVAKAKPAKTKPAKTKPSKTFGTVVAYGLVKPLCVGCASRPRNFDPLVPNESAGVTLISQPGTYEQGTWCFRLTSAEPARGRQVVIVSLESGEPGEPLGPPGDVSVASAQWVAGAPDCQPKKEIDKPKEIEIKTLRYSSSPPDSTLTPRPPDSGLTATPTGEVPFSFVVIR